MNVLANGSVVPAAINIKNARASMLRVESDASLLSATPSEIEDDDFCFANLEDEYIPYETALKFEDDQKKSSDNGIIEEMGVCCDSKEPVGFEIQILSDVHTEFLASSGHGSNKRSQEFYEKFDQLLQPTAKYLALLGDIGCPGTQDGFCQFQEFISRLEGKFEHVFLVAGNHEFYCRGNQRMHMEEIKQRIRKYCKRKGFVTFLDNESVVIPVSSSKSVRIVGTTLWSDVSCEPGLETDIVNSIADFRNIYVSDSEWNPEKYCSLRSLQAEDVRKLHRDDVQFIISQVGEAAKLDEAVIILSHHAPSFRGTSPAEYSSGPDHSSKEHKFSTAFASELDYLFSTSDFQRSVYAWAYGHTHHSNRQVFQGIQIVSNQLGYMHKHEHCICDSSCVVHI
eukprot:TRINITY_DN6864_c0_g1_i1.p1 TRINITY_DN6864_c0_g1~~TRINITY_DN6864_c0_g1_i1.p1  ORF type:complete len:451 (+),score=86.98 TRINITY_DN6864_c0_g1_i1:168-1355(+)